MHALDLAVERSETLADLGANSLLAIITNSGVITMAKQKLSKNERRKRNKQRRESNKAKFIKEKQELAYFLGLGGKWSELELLVLSAAKFNFTPSGTENIGNQLKKAIRLMIRHDKPISSKIRTKKDFYSSRAWQILRYQAFEKYGNRCQCCGGTPEDGLTMHVDHIKPKSTHPELALDLNNLQILCIDCNVGKINQWDTDWRP